jgi:hypothetical protein
MQVPVSFIAQRYLSSWQHSTLQNMVKCLTALCLCMMLGYSVGLAPEVYAKRWHEAVTQKTKQRLENLQRPQTQKVPLGLTIQGSTPLQGFHPLNQQKWILLKGIPQALGLQSQRQLQGMPQLTLTVTDPTWVDPLGLDRIKVLLRTQPSPIQENLALWRADVSSLKQEGRFQWQLLLGQKVLSQGELVIDTGVYWQTLKVGLQSFYYQQLGTPLTLPLASLTRETMPTIKSKPKTYPALWPRQYDTQWGESILKEIPQGWCVPVAGVKRSEVPQGLGACWQGRASEVALQESITWLLLAYQMNPNTHARLGLDLPLEMLETYGTKKTPEWLVVVSPAVYQLSQRPINTDTTPQSQKLIALYQALMTPYDTLKPAQLGKASMVPIETLWDTLATTVVPVSEASLFAFAQKRFQPEEGFGMKYRALLHQAILQGLTLLSDVSSMPTEAPLSSDFFAQWQNLSAVYDALTGHNASQYSMVSGWSKDWQQTTSLKQPAIQYPQHPQQHPFAQAWQTNLPGMLQPTGNAQDVASMTPQLQAQWVFFLALMNRLSEQMLVHHPITSDSKKRWL